jgi:chemotaxis protein methyltransferase WspC
MTNDQRKIEDLLISRIGLDPVSMGPHLVLRAARRRMSEVGAADLGDYAARLLASEAEQQALIEEVVVPESWFFRDERPFRWLADHARARWVADPTRPPLRALSLPCAGGQEPYSIAITLRDAGLAPGRLRIDAVDISARLLEIARRGVYSANAFRDGVGWVQPTDAGRGDPGGLHPPYSDEPTLLGRARFPRSRSGRPSPPLDAPLPPTSPGLRDRPGHPLDGPALPGEHPGSQAAGGFAPL